MNPLWNGLKSPLWNSTRQGVWFPLGGSPQAGGGPADPGNTILQEDSFNILQEDNTYILQEA